MTATCERNQHQYGNQELPHLSPQDVARLINVYGEASRITRCLLDDPDLTPVLKSLVEESALPLAATETRFAADGVVFGAAAYDEESGLRWRYAAPGAGADAVRAHIVCGTSTGIVAAAEVDGTGSGSGSVLPGLLRKAKSGFPGVEEATAGRAYLNKAGFEAAAELGIRLYIPFKPNSKLSGQERLRSQAWEEAFHFYQNHYGEFQERYRSHAAVDGVMDAIEDRTGTCVHAKTETGRVNEVLVKLVIHNFCVVAEAKQIGALDGPVAGVRETASGTM